MRAWHSSIMSQFKSTAAEHLWPQQIAVGVQGGLSLLILGVRLALETHPTWVAIKIDLRNAYNELMRAVVLARLHDQEHLKALMPLFWATYRAKSAIFLLSQGLLEADFASEEGMRQGDPLASTGCCIGIVRCRASRTDRQRAG